MKIRLLNPRSFRKEDLLAAAAEARGCRTEEEIREFLDPDPALPRGIFRLPDYQTAKRRIAAALERREKVVLFGDYDCDGITSLVQMHDLFTAAGRAQVAWFVPDRMRHDYGLTIGAARECVARHEPQLLIALDCGSTAYEPICELGRCGIDVIVVDHHNLDDGRITDQHGPAGGRPRHPALAHLNPLVGDQGDPRIRSLTEMSAAGLTFFFCQQLAEDLGITAWSADRACLLAGLGTVVDVMPLVRINRMLVKRALRLANVVERLALVPGLCALRALIPAGRIDVRTLSHQWGPRLNAAGRMEDASLPIRLLLTGDAGTARVLAEGCEKINRERQAVQRGIEEEAVRIVEDRLAQDLPERVLLLHNADWHAGVVGIVASRLRERFTRPAIVCAWHEDGYWKGSGRSPEGFDLGQAVQDAVHCGLLLGGGGHPMAAGVKIAPDRLEQFRDWLNERCLQRPEDFGQVHEVWAPLDARVSASDRVEARIVLEEWCVISSELEPFGVGNPRPVLLLRQAEMRWGPKDKLRRDTGEAWAVSAGFTWAGSGYLFAEWLDVPRARAEWQAGYGYDLLLSPQTSSGVDRSTGRSTIYYNLRVVDCERTGS